MATMKPHSYLVVDWYPTKSNSCRLGTNMVPCVNNQFHPNDVFHIISPVIDSFKNINYMESTPGVCRIESNA